MDGKSVEHYRPGPRTLERWRQTDAVTFTREEQRAVKRLKALAAKVFDWSYEDAAYDVASSPVSSVSLPGSQASASPAPSCASIASASSASIRSPASRPDLPLCSIDDSPAHGRDPHCFSDPEECGEDQPMSAVF
jgi:hypothetical protein